MNIYEKIGDFVLNVIQLVIGGIIFAAIMADASINRAWLYGVAIVIVVVFFVVALVLFKLSNRYKKEE